MNVSCDQTTQIPTILSAPIELNVDADFPPQHGRVVGDDEDDDSPSGREVPPAESLHRRAKVLLPKFRLETAVLRLECPLLFF